MEYVPGEDLKSSLRRTGPLSVGKAVIIAKKVIFGGVYVWDMEKRDDSWKIKSISARPIEKK